MTLFQQINRMERIHYLIRSASTGEPNRFADRLNLSRRQLYNLLDEMKDYGAEIKYSRMNQTFFYETPFHLMVKVEMKNLSTDECASVFGGSAVNGMWNISIKVFGFSLS